MSPDSPNPVLAAFFGDQRGTEINEHPLLYLERHQVHGLVQEHGGSVLGSSSRDVLASFTSGDKALGCATELRSMILKLRDSGPERAGLHCRVVLARAAAAGAGGIPVKQTLEALAWSVGRAPENSLAATDDFMQTLSRPPEPMPPALGQAKNGRAPLYVLEAEAEAEEASPTRVVPFLQAAAIGTYAELVVRVGSGPLRTLVAADCPVRVGRGQHCGVVINADSASRVHGRFEYGGEKFYFADESRNGTYILTQAGAEFRIVGERHWLAGEGFISLGVPVKNQQPDAVIRFRCKPVQLKLDEA